MNENVVKILRHPATLPTITGIACFGIGYLIGRRNKIVAHTVPVTNNFWENIESESEQNIVIRVPQIIEESTRFSMDSSDSVIIEEVEMELNGAQFAGETEEWDQEKEEASRNEVDPYVIHKDEFYSDEKGFSQTTLTLYAGDDIMVDQDDKPVYNHSSVVGPLRFGHGSDDPNVFYVRNPKRKAEFEVIFDTGLYSEIVLGLEIEQNDRAQDLKHSHSVHKFRPE